MSQFDIDLLRQINALERRIDALERVEYSGSIVAAKYRTNAAQSIANASYTIVDFEDQDYDTHSAVTVGAAWKFTAPLAGYYHVSVSILYNTTTTWAEGEHAILSLYKNGTQIDEIARANGLDSSGSSSYKKVGGAGSISLAVNDYIDIRTYQNSGAALALINLSVYNYVTIEKVG